MLNVNHCLGGFHDNLLIMIADALYVDRFHLIGLSDGQRLSDKILKYADNVRLNGTRCHSCCSARCRKQLFVRLGIKRKKRSVSIFTLPNHPKRWKIGCQLVVCPDIVVVDDVDLY